MFKVTDSMVPFKSGIPKVKLINAFSRPYENAVATARTCYSSKGIISCEEVSGDNESNPIKKAAREKRRDDLAKSIYQAGHHTTLQHSHFQFSLENVSRHFIWSFLHAHPFYNSEQVSQRYVEVKEDAVVVPSFQKDIQEILYRETIERQMKTYHVLIEKLLPLAGDEYYRIFPARKNNPKYLGDIKKKAQEIARYVLPIGTSAYMYHTVSGITLLRYWKLANVIETSLETKWVIGRMIEELMAFDPLFASILEEPMDIQDTPELQAYEKFVTTPKKFREEFDLELNGKTSLLIDYKINNERSLADSVREVLGLTRETISDQDAIELALNPAQNKIIGQTMNLSTLSKLTRCLFHPSYTFKKKLSHTADSQDQRHRMTPASRPVILMHLDNEPDYIVPTLIQKNENVLKLFKNSMNESWEAYAKLRTIDVSQDLASYVLPNALSVRFTESSDLLNLHHKMKMRLCYNAQEEIWKASLDESTQIEKINPSIGKYLLPPCSLRSKAKLSPICPEGDRYCGVPVWRIEKENYKRTI